MNNYDKSILNNQNMLDNMDANEPDNTMVYLVVTDDKSIDFSSNNIYEAYSAFNCASDYFELAGYTKLELREIPYSDFINGKDKHNIQNSTLIEFKEL